MTMTTSIDNNHTARRKTGFWTKLGEWTRAFDEDYDANLMQDLHKQVTVLEARVAELESKDN